MRRSRVKSGVPTGGEFASQPRNEASVVLVSGPNGDSSASDNELVSLALLSDNDIESVEAINAVRDPSNLEEFLVSKGEDVSVAEREAVLRRLIAMDESDGSPTVVVR